MRLRFLRDFGGEHTHYIHYRAGQIVDLPDTQAAELLKQGRVCERVAEVAPPEPRTPPPDKKRMHD